MQRLRTTFKRSRTPTGAEMKTQSSLEVPRQVRSASFDEIQLEARKAEHGSFSPTLEVPPVSLLKVPQPGMGPKSFEIGVHQTSEEPGMFLEVPTRKYQRRRSSGDKSTPFCIHCFLLEDLNLQKTVIEEQEPSRSLSYSDTSSSSLEWEEADNNESESRSASESPPPCTSITVTFSDSPPETFDMSSEEPSGPSGRRRSIMRQEAFVFNESWVDPSLKSVQPESGPIVSQFFLAVPELKRDRAASVDSCFLSKSASGTAKEIVAQPSSEFLQPPVLGPAALRSRSVDIVLPTDQQARYKALAMNSASASSCGTGTLSEGAKPTLVTTPKWEGDVIEGEHIWSSYAPSSEICYVADSDCTKQGQKLRCSGCKIVAHSNCLQLIADDVKLHCKPSFRNVGLRCYREQCSTKHHWVHRRTQKGKCQHCGKSKLSFGSKDIVAISCAWCKSAFHNKDSCFNAQKLEEDCNLGVHSSIVVPPTWIVKLPRKGSFKSSLRISPTKSSSKKGSKEKTDRDSCKRNKTFTIKPIPTVNIRPVIVFINPKSGGNQGSKLLQKFHWLLNPRQVFDLTQGGPKMGLQMYRKVPNLRVLACGGDGTVGWVLSVIDQLCFNPPPAVGVLPLGTGNDLARALGWGGGYTDEPISKILSNISEGEVIHLDRWELKVEKNSNATGDQGEGKDNLPLNVVNNYFSLGVDAHIALEFHEAREAHPEKFNSRLRNKMFYGQMGGKDLLKRKWKGLADFVTLECDGKDLTPKVKEHKFHAIVFLNIASYGGGTHPWPRGNGTEPSTDDGLIEVVGLTTYQLPFLQAGGHGTSICQCKTAIITTFKTIPMQVDGEACKLNPSIITMSLLNKAPMIAKRKGRKGIVSQAVLEPMKISVHKINMMDYEQLHHDKNLLKQSAMNIGELELTPAVDLEQVRQLINNLQIPGSEEGSRLSPDWSFVDSCTAERFFRIDRAQESLHYVTDIASDALYILDPLPSVSDDEGVEEASQAVFEIRVSNVTRGEKTVNTSLTKNQSNDSSFDEASAKTPTKAGTPTRPSTPTKASTPTRPGTPTKVNLELASPTFASNLENAANYKRILLEKNTDKIIKAAKQGDIKALKELHSQGYSLLSIDSSGQTALHHAAFNGFKDIVQYLLASAPHSVLNMADNEKGQTALHKAARNGHRNICCMLVAGGASLDQVDQHGNTAKALALEANDVQLASYLESQERFQIASDDFETTV